MGRRKLTLGKHCKGSHFSWDERLKLQYCFAGSNGYRQERSPTALGMIFHKSAKTIIAYFEGKWSRPMDIISGFRLILFDKQYSLTMMRAIMDFLDYLFRCRGCHAFNWTVAVKNEHAYRIYEKFIKNHCGHRVGLRHHAQKGYAGEISDIVLYEITKDEYFEYKGRMLK